MKKLLLFIFLIYINTQITPIIDNKKLPQTKAIPFSVSTSVTLNPIEAKVTLVNFFNNV
jgi:hypothetical protein